jgi:hypothetical protein
MAPRRAADRAPARRSTTCKAELAHNRKALPGFRFIARFEKQFDSSIFANLYHSVCPFKMIQEALKTPDDLQCGVLPKLARCWRRQEP